MRPCPPRALIHHAVILVISATSESLLDQPASTKLCEVQRAPISLLDENNKGFWPDTIMFHRRSACFTLHDRLESDHVVDVHRQSDAIGIIRLNERADVQ